MAGSKKKQPSYKVPMADVSHGSEWLHQLTEPQFRDELLKDLFAEMKKQGAILDYLYTHGPHEHGVDWIVLEKGTLSQRYVGIQAKSQPISRQGATGKDSALAVKQQCLSAFDHTFNWSGTTVRLDVVELWMSSHITSDSIEEFNAPLGKRIPVKEAERVFSLFEQHCPRAISRIPGLAVAGYLRQMSDPEPLPIKILGVNLNPQRHFLEPRFSRHPSLSPDRIFLDPRTKKALEEKPTYLEDILASRKHAIVVGPELSGKSYLLKRAACVLAHESRIPVLLDGAKIALGGVVDTQRVLRNHLNWYSPEQFKGVGTNSGPLAILVDNSDALAEEQLKQLAETAGDGIQLVLAGRKSRSLAGYVTYYIAGVRDGSLQRFVRSLDIEHSAAAVLMDRAVKYLGRTIGISGLPMNPFTVSVMLEECRVARKKLATPSMGRLIERFVLGQLGSHSDSTRVDFETKDRFLTELGGKHANIFTQVEFRRRLARYIAIHGHAHSREDFEQDLLESGLLVLDPVTTELAWGHPIFSDFFWVRNLVRENRYVVLARVLQSREAPAIAAIAGSQLTNAHDVFIRLIKALPHQQWADGSTSFARLKEARKAEIRLPTDADEEKLLQEIETEGDADQEAPPAVEKAPSTAVSTRDDTTLNRKISTFAARYVEEKHSLVGNLSALLLNARALNREDKLSGVLCVIRSNILLGRHFSDVIRTIGGKHVNELNADVLSRFIGLTINDLMIADGHLATIFKDLYQKVQATDEKLFLKDALVASGSASPSEYLEVIKENNDVADTVAVYFRLVNLYYYRHHKGLERNEIKDAMKNLRKQAKGIPLATLV